MSSRVVAAGTGVGYGLDHVVPRRTALALLPVGYGDGLPRTASHRAEVLVRGRRRPIVGRISMDMVVVDTGDDRIRPGESVTLFGPGDGGEPTVADWARWADTIPRDRHPHRQPRRPGAPHDSPRSRDPSPGDET
nr:hypothetical protein GCM10025699_77120 [Microbacterium flavescens]